MNYNIGIDKKAMVERMAERVHQFATRMEEYMRSTYNETEVRVEFVNPPHIIK